MLPLTGCQGLFLFKDRRFLTGQHYDYIFPESVRVSPQGKQNLFARMSEDGVRKSSNPLVSMTAGAIAGGIECIAGPLTLHEIVAFCRC